MPLDEDVNIFKSRQAVHAAQAARGGGGGSRAFGSGGGSKGIGITVDVSDLSAKLNALRNGFISAKNNPTIMRPAVYYFAKGVQYAFDSESTPTGRHWQGLSGMTRDIREKRGYNRDHPILNQSGGLRDMAVNELQAWSKSGSGGSISKSSTAAYNNSGDTILTATMSHRVFTATISGPKVANNFGVMPVTQRRGKGGRFVAKKPITRQFWGFSHDTLDKATRGIVGNLMGEWASSMGHGTTGSNVTSIWK